MDNKTNLFAAIDSPYELPKRQTRHAAGYDLRAAETVEIVGGAGTYCVKTGVRLAGMRPGYFGKVEVRSGLARHQHLAVSAGVIDSDYTGEIMALIYCTKVGHRYTVTAGDRIVQMVIHKLDYDYAYHSGWLELVSDATRNGGFGSTGST